MASPPIPLVPLPAPGPQVGLAVTDAAKELGWTVAPRRHPMPAMDVDVGAQWIHRPGSPRPATRLPLAGPALVPPQARAEEDIAQ